MLCLIFVHVYSPIALPPIMFVVNAHSFVRICALLKKKKNCALKFKDDRYYYYY